MCFVHQIMASVIVIHQSQHSSVLRCSIGLQYIAFRCDTNTRSLFRIITPHPIGERSIVMSVSVCVSVCLRVRLSVDDHISGTTHPIFTKFL